MSEAGSSLPKDENPSSKDVEAEGDIRCPCGDMADRGMMICCDSCNVWQHSGCVGIEGALPEEYLCDLCDPESFWVRTSILPLPPTPTDPRYDTVMQCRLKHRDETVQRSTDIMLAGVFFLSFFELIGLEDFVMLFLGKKKMLRSNKNLKLRKNQKKNVKRSSLLL